MNSEQEKQQKLEEKKREEHKKEAKSWVKDIDQFTGRIIKWGKERDGILVGLATGLLANSALIVIGVTEIVILITTPLGLAVLAMLLWRGQKSWALDKVLKRKETEVESYIQLLKDSKDLLDEDEYKELQKEFVLIVKKYNRQAGSIDREKIDTFILVTLQERVERKLKKIEQFEDEPQRAINQADTDTLDMNQLRNINKEKLLELRQRIELEIEERE